MEFVYLLPMPDNKFFVDVVGESKTQRAIKEVVAYKIMVDKDDLEHRDQKLIAHLILEDNNKFDPGNAVRVDIDNQPVGYLSAHDASRYRKALAKKELKDVVGVCRASAYGKREDFGEKMNYGIWLSFDLDHLEIGEETQVQHPKKKGCGLFVIPLLIIFIMIFISACTSSTPIPTATVDESAWYACKLFVEKQYGINTTDGELYNSSGVLSPSFNEYVVVVYYAKYSSNYICEITRLTNGDWKLNSLDVQ